MQVHRQATVRFAPAIVAGVALIATTAGCGSSSSTSSHGGRTASTAGLRITVFAAASLSKVFPVIDPHPHYEFGGSDVLQTQIEQGAPADAFASASPKQTTALFAKGLVRKPVDFATNTLVMIVPRANPAHIHSVYDVRRPGVKLVIGDATVPVGAYTRTVLGRLHLTDVMSNVRSEDTDVSQVLSQVRLGQADAGFAYTTDVRSSQGAVSAIAIPAPGSPRVVYQIAAVSKTSRLSAARAFVARVLSPRGQQILQAAGFGKP